MPKTKRRHKNLDSFVMRDETTHTHRPKRVLPHLASEVAEQSNYSTPLLYQLTRNLRAPAVRALGIRPVDPHNMS